MTSDALPQTLGQEIAEGAVVPERIAVLMAHVAENLDAQATWVGTSTPEAAAEHDALTSLASHYRSIAKASAETAETMRSLRTLSPAPHDPARFDHAVFGRWMRRKIELQVALAELLLEHARASENALA
jgi:hypothetical protein